MHSKNIAYIPAVDQLRGIAALWITIYHAAHLIGYQLRFNHPFTFDFWPSASNPVTALILEGHSAVGLFMVLSGFILTYGAWGKKISYKAFITNRFIRIYPLAIFLVLVAAYSKPQAFSWGSLWQTLLLGHNLPGSLSGSPYTDMFWAIAVEFQFYLIFPFLCFLMQKEDAYLGLKIMACLITFRFIASINGANVRDLGYLSIVGRLDQFLIGMMLGAYWKNRGDKRGSTTPFYLLAVCGVLALLLYAFNQLGGWPSVAAWKVIWPTVEGVICAALIFFYLSSAQRLPGLVTGILQHIGLVSYSLYLTHMLVLSILCEHGWLISFQMDIRWAVILNTLFLMLPISLILAALTYHAIEQPFLKFRQRYL